MSMSWNSHLRRSSSPDAPLCSRREFLSAASLTTAAVLAGCTTTPDVSVDIIDTHTHFYDPTRPQGVPWPPKNDAVLHRPVYPEEFKKLAQPHGVTGTVVVEASPWLQDNQWVLDLVAHDRFLLGLVGNIKPGRSEFRDELKRFEASPLLRGIRIGVWEKSPLAEDISVVRDLKLLAERNLTLDVLTAPDQLGAVAKLAAAVPDLRIVIDHCANVRVDGQPPPVAWLEGLRACSPYRNVFMKVSGLVEGTGRAEGSAPTDAAFYQPVLDAIWETFGDDRVIYGSNWPVSARFASYATVFAIANGYFGTKGRVALQKYFAANAGVAYKVTSA
jgi:L-fucono-1,5-lactonase